MTWHFEELHLKKKFSDDKKYIDTYQKTIYYSYYQLVNIEIIQKLLLRDGRGTGPMMPGNLPFKRKGANSCRRNFPER
jgi:hypothetical protein